jgi:hypothetical protein
MKKIIFAITLVFSLLVFKNTQAQLSISINIGSQPTWGPTGYNHVDYYYFPDIDCYYYVPTQQFIYLSGSQWIYASALPARYGNYDLYNGYKVVINGTSKPYLRASYYRTHYAAYKGRRGQTIIRDSRDPKYKPNNNRPGNGRPPVRPQPKPQPSRPGNNRPPVKPQPKPQPQPSRPGGNRPSPSKPQPSRPSTKPAPGKGDDNRKDDHK